VVGERTISAMANPFPPRTPIPGQQQPFNPPPNPLGQQQPMQPMQPLPGTAYDPWKAVLAKPEPRGRFHIGPVTAWLLVSLVITVLTFGAVWYFGNRAQDQVRDSIDDAQQSIDAALGNDGASAGASADDPLASLGLAGGERLLWQGGAAAALSSALDAGIAGTPTHFTQIVLQDTYAVSTAQDATKPQNVDMYTWRDGDVSTLQAVPTPDDLASGLFTVADVDWAAIAPLAAEAPRLIAIDDAAVTHVIVQRDSFAADQPVEILVYVSGPRGGGYVQADAHGMVVKVNS
jgi:hypothetical protein